MMRHSAGNFPQCFANHNWLKFSPLLIGASLLLVACRPQTTNIEQLQQGLVYCSEGNPESFNPQLGTSGTTVDATAAQLYDRLLDYDDTSKKFVPTLATKWETLDEGRRYRFHLREGVIFHSNDRFTPTRAFNADDVVFSFHRWLDENHPFHHVSGGQYPFFTSSGLDKLIQSVEKVDDLTVDFTLARPDSSFLANLATDFAVILSAEYGQKMRAAGTLAAMDYDPIGTGPYTFIEFRKDVLIRYERHEDYWREAPQIQQLVYAITPNANKRMLKLLTRECDVVPYPLVNELASLNVDGDIQVADEVNPNIAFWAFNTKRKPFDNPKVRQALSYAINRPAILQNIYSGNAQLANSLLPETSWAFSDAGENYNYDPERALRMLREAGLNDGFSMTIWAMPVQRAYNPDAQRMAELMQADLAAVGIRARIVSYEWNTFRRRLARGEHDTVLIGWVADNADPDNFFRPLLSCAAVGSGNRANYCDPQLDALLVDAISETDQDARGAIYEQVQARVKEQVPLLPIANSLRYQAHLSNIVGVQLPPYGGISFRHAKRLTDTELELIELKESEPEQEQPEANP